MAGLPLGSLRVFALSVVSVFLLATGIASGSGVREEGAASECTPSRQSALRAPAVLRPDGASWLRRAALGRACAARASRTLQRVGPAQAPAAARGYRLLANNPPLKPTEDAFPDGEVTANQSGPFRIKYSDPDSDPGTMTYRVYRDADDLLMQTKTSGTLVNGQTANVWLDSPLTPDVYYWIATPQDNQGAFGPPSDPYFFQAVAAPVIPDLVLPSGSIASPSVVTSTTPVLKASASGAAGLSFEFRVTTDTGCSTVKAASPTVGSVPNASSNNVATWPVEPGKLLDGATYYWCARTVSYGTTDGSGTSAWTAAKGITVKIPTLGVRDYWPMFERGPLAVHEATGNLVVSFPGPSYDTGIGELSAAPVYNSLDTRASGSLGLSELGVGWVLGTVGNVPVKLLDHTQFPAAEQFDAIERVSADGSSDYYAHVGDSRVYQAEPGDASVLVHNPDDTWTLSDPDGSFYRFGSALQADKSYELVSAEVAVGAASTASYAYTFTAGRPTVIAAKQSGTTLASLTLDWACAGAKVCISGPDGRVWKYVVDGSGRLLKVTRVSADATVAKDIAAVTYNAGGLVDSYESANDLNPSDATLTNYRTAHQILIAYTAGKVTSVTDGPIQSRYINAGSDVTPVWSFSYTCSGGLSLPTPAASHPGATFPAAAVGCTEVKPPNQQPSGTKVARVWYDALYQPLKSASVVDIDNSKYTLSLLNGSHQLLWSEDQTGAATDNTYDAVDGTLTKTEQPDPDGGGSLGRPTTSYRYDETKSGDAVTAGPALAGLKGMYWNGSAVSGRPIVIRTDTNVDFTWASEPAPLVNANDFYVRWSGDVVVGAGQQGAWTFSTVATGGSRLVVDGNELISRWGGQTNAAPVCAPTVDLAAGKHKLVLEYKDSGTGSADIELRAAHSSDCASAVVLPNGSAMTLQPAWLNQTTVVAPSNANARYSFTHFAAPETGNPDYTLVRANSLDHITSYEYDGFGRLVKQWMPKGNQARTIDSGGNLTGSPNNDYLTQIAYYQPTDPAIAPDALCSIATTASQAGLQKSVTHAGLTARVTVYDSGGRPASARSAKGAICSSYDKQGRLSAEAEKDGVTTVTTNYVYHPDDSLYEAYNASLDIVINHNEAGWVTRQTDGWGSELRYLYDVEGNPFSEIRRYPGPSERSTTSTFNAGNQLVSKTDWAGRSYAFFYDTRGNLVGTNYPTTTASFSFKTYNPAGWLDSIVNRDGTLTSPGGATGNAPTTAPADATPIADFAYTYFQDGQKQTEARKVGSAATETTSYGYDAIGRLETVAFPDATSRRYCYDLDSNRTRWNTSTTGDCATGTAGATYTYSATKLDQLSSVTQGATTTYTYNNDGDLTGRGTDTLSWDVRDRLSGAVVPGRTVTYTFDPLGFRSQRSVLNGYLGAVLDAQPTNYWRLGETAGTTAVDRIAASNGTYTGGVVLNQTGAITSDTDPAVDLDGTNDWITTPLTLSTNRLKRFAIEAWVRPEGTPTPPSGSYTIAGINGSIKLSLLSSRAIRLSYVDAGAVTRTLDSTTTLPLNAYRHVVAQYTGSQALIYIDGILRGSATLPAPAGNANTLSIGNTSAATNWFNGKLDELALYPHPLTPGEVYTHKTRGTTAAATTTVRYRLGGLEETDTAGQIIRKDINAPDGTDILSDTLDPVSLSDSTNWLYYNGHGDLAAETSTSTTNPATPTTTHTYDPYGTPLDSTTSNASDVSANGTTERYTSQWDKKLDITTNLIEMGARPYDPQLGRFLTTDPIHGGSLNTYDYTGQDPINNYDLDGRAVAGGPFGDRLGGRTSVYAGVRRILMRAERHGSIRARTWNVKGGLNQATADFLSLTTGNLKGGSVTTSPSGGGAVFTAFLKSGGRVVLRPGTGTSKLPKLEVHDLPLGRGLSDYKFTYRQ